MDNSFLLWWLGGTTGSSSGVTDILGLPEGLNDHGVHGWEVSLDHVLTHGRVSHTEVLLQVESILSDPEWVSHVGSNHLQSLHTLLTGVPRGLLEVTIIILL